MKSKKVLVTGGSGFVGSHLVPFLVKKGYFVVIFDKLKPDFSLKNTIFVQGNILSTKQVDKVFSKEKFDTVYHLAAALPNKAISNNLLWKTNVIGSKNIVEKAVEKKVKSFIFTSSNTVYGIPSKIPVTENAPLDALEIYGKSKKEAEGEIIKFCKKINVQMFRCPVISGIGRLGLQAILFEFISESKKVYVLGGGRNKYQFVDVDDLCIALEKASSKKGCKAYNIGSDNILQLRDIYMAVIKHAKSKSQIVDIPKIPSMLVLSILDKLNLSPLGVYQYTMLGRSLYADTKKIKRSLGWKPKKTNAQLFIENYDWYIKNRGNFKKLGESKLSDNRSLPKMGVLKLLKLLS